MEEKITTKDGVSGVVIGYARKAHGAPLCYVVYDTKHCREVLVDQDDVLSVLPTGTPELTLVVNNS